MPGGTRCSIGSIFSQADLLTGLKPTAAFALLVANLPYCAPGRVGTAAPGNQDV